MTEFIIKLKVFFKQLAALFFFCFSFLLPYKILEEYMPDYNLVSIFGMWLLFYGLGAGLFFVLQVLINSIIGESLPPGLSKVFNLILMTIIAGCLLLILDVLVVQLKSNNFI
jgi:hypothetical protein